MTLIMKNTKILSKSTTLVCASLLFLASCKKEDASFQEANQTNSNQLKSSGVVADDPSRVGVVPFEISDSYFQAQANLVSGNVYGATLQGLTSRTRTADKTAPVVSITSPANNAIVSGTINIQASASDNVGVTLVSFYVDNVLVGSKTSSPYSVSWNTVNASSGNHLIKVTAQDAAGNISNSSIQVGINTTSSGDIAAPSVTITSPATGTSFNIGQTISVSVSASDNTGVAYVLLSVDGVATGTAYTAPYSFTVNTNNLSSSTHTITATAYDGYSNSASSSVLIALNAVIVTTPVLPSTFELLMPPVQNQGGEGSCCVFAAAYGARSAEQYYKTNSTSYSYNTNVVSPEYVYNQVKATSDCGSGTSITAALDLLVSQGACTWQSMPYSSQNGCSTMPTSSQISEASSFKITSYSKIITSDITSMKNMIVNKHPLIISIVTDNSFLTAGPGFIWRTQTGTSVGHALAICGFDDAKHAYKVFNSWGTGWGDAGYSWIDYDLLPIVGSYYTYIIQN